MVCSVSSARTIIILSSALYLLPSFRVDTTDVNNCMLHYVSQVSAVPLSRKVRTMRQTAGNTQGARTAMILLRTSGYLSLPEDLAIILQQKSENRRIIKTKSPWMIFCWDNASRHLRKKLTRVKETGSSVCLEIELEAECKPSSAVLVSGCLCPHVLASDHSAFFPCLHEC